MSEKELISELDWMKLQLAEKDVALAQANAREFQSKLDLLKRDLILVYKLTDQDKVNPDRSIIRGQPMEENKLA